MEVLIVLVILSIVGYLIYQSLPSSKYNAGCKLLDQKKYNEATIIFDALFQKHVEAPAKLASCYLNQGLASKEANPFDVSYFQKALDIKSRLNGNYNKNSFELVESKSHYELVASKYASVTKQTTPEDNAIATLDDNIRRIETCTKVGLEKEFSSIRNIHFVEISLIYFKRGIANEKTSDYIAAIKNYNTAIEYREKAFKGQSYSDIVCRREICKLKLGDVINYEVVKKDLDEASNDIKSDFYFRYVLKLLTLPATADVLKKAEELIKAYLQTDKAEVKILLTHISNYKKKNASAKIELINKRLEYLFAENFPLKQTKEFYEEIDAIIPEIEKVLPELKTKLNEIKPSLFNKLLMSSIDQKVYDEAINLILGYSDFWTVPELLKNLGICCFGLVNAGELNEQNYQIVISSWLTAVYSDKVVLKSLDSTSWDDDYTFTLIDAVGSQYQNHTDLPENANYEDISDSNISIGTTQRELIKQFEAILNNKLGEDFEHKKAHEFYSQEKNAVEKIIETIPSDILLAAPYFAKAFPSVATDIIEELNDDYSEYSNESALEAGLLYLTGNTPITKNTVSEYDQADKVKREFVKAVKSSNVSKLLEINKDEDKKAVVRKYPSFKTSLEDELFNYFHTQIELDSDNEKLISLIAQSINLLIDANKLRFLYSNFVTDFCISRVNDDRMDNFAALKHLKNAYVNAKDNVRICKNLIALIKMNLFDIINDRTKSSTDIYKILDEIKTKKSQTYKNHCGELTKARRDLLAQFPADARALILAGTNLSPEGLKIRKGLSYLVELGDGDDFTDLSDLFKAR